ncbi:MAG TPA: ribbon-helix-helix protein, CopG family [Pyrinomonadaceae bacterium]|nr:ribbon-helix-helix protein, CopG family [Pyrinomonadaceae bacterium]
MSRTLTISDELYDRLEKEARMRGVSIERLIEEWERSGAALLQRTGIVREIDDLRERLFSKYGEMPDSTDLVREDRTR